MDSLATELDASVREGSILRTTVCIEQEGASAKDLRHDAVATRVSVQMLELLTEHGYDPGRPGLRNTGERGRRLIDYSTVLGNGDVVQWLVARGVSLTHGQDTNEFDVDVVPMPQPLLELAAQHSSLETFKVLFDSGAKLGRRTLHCAILFAAAIKADPSIQPTQSEWPAFQPTKKFGKERKRMSEILPFLVDELKLDVNALDIEGRREPPGFYGTPLCYAVYEDGAAVVRWLLSKGADPREVAAPEERVNAVHFAKAMRAERSLKVIEEWKASNG